MINDLNDQIILYDLDTNEIIFQEYLDYDKSIGYSKNDKYIYYNKNDELYLRDYSTFALIKKYVLEVPNDVLKKLCFSEKLNQFVLIFREKMLVFDCNKQKIIFEYKMNLIKNTSIYPMFSMESEYFAMGVDEKLILFQTNNYHINSSIFYYFDCRINPKFILKDQFLLINVLQHHGSAKMFLYDIKRKRTHNYYEDHFPGILNFSQLAGQYFFHSSPSKINVYAIQQGAQPEDSQNVLEIVAVRNPSQRPKNHYNKYRHSHQPTRSKRESMEDQEMEDDLDESFSSQNQNHK